MTNLRQWQRTAIFERDDYTCRYCSREITTTHDWHEWARRWIPLIHVDHVIPKSKGGTNDPDNLVTACRDCNLAKYDNEWEPIPFPAEPWYQAHEAWLRHQWNAKG